MRQTFRFAQRVMKQPVLFKCNIAPRAATEDEIGDLFDYYEYECDMPRSDAQGVVECMTIAVFDDRRAVLIPNSGKVLVAFARAHPNEVNVFTWGNDSLSLVRTYVER